MSAIARIADLFRFSPAPVPVRQPEQRAWVTGPAAVDQSVLYYGWGDDSFTPPEYGDYIATSNGVYACATLRAKSLSSLPLRLYTGTGDNRTEVTSGSARQFFDSVNPYWTFPRLIEMTELSLCLWGEAFWFLEKRGRVPVECWWARPDRVRVVPSATDYVSHFVYEHDGKRIRFERDETMWLRFPNPLDEFQGLSPLAAARLAADTASAAMHSNRNIFHNGIQMAGIVKPKSGTMLTEEQGSRLERQLSTRFQGVDKAHRWGVLRFEADFQSLSMSPKDAEFLGALRWSLEDICRAYGVPLDLIGGQRTYENVQAAERSLWANTVKPEARFIATELTEQLLPMFGGKMVAEFDLADVEVLHEAETERWTRWKEQIASGAVTINEWRAGQGLDPVKWGDVWWQSVYNVPVELPVVPDHPMFLHNTESANPATVPAGDDEPANTDEDQADADRGRARATTSIAYGSPEHVKRWNRFTKSTQPWERQVAKVTTELMQRQKASVLARLNARGTRDAEAVADEPFDRARWVKAFRVTMRPVLAGIVEDAGTLAIDELALPLRFDVKDPAVVRFLEGRAQRFAEAVNETTWVELKASLGEGIDAGEDIKQLGDRVEAVMADRIRSSKEVIARTETIGAANGGTLEAWKQTGVVTGKVWLAALDDRTRDTHVLAHGQTVGIDEDFEVGAGSGPAPGQIGLAEEDIQCRCSMTAVLDVQGVIP